MLSIFLLFSFAALRERHFNNLIHLEASQDVLLMGCDKSKFLEMWRLFSLPTQPKLILFFIFLYCLWKKHFFRIQLVCVVCMIGLVMNLILIYGRYVAQFSHSFLYVLEEKKKIFMFSSINMGLKFFFHVFISSAIR
jgi:hypothetical protein